MKRIGLGRLTIKGRITLWYAMLFLALCIAVVGALAAASERAAMAFHEETLRSASVILLDEMEVEHGLLEIDSDIDEVPNVYAALFDEAGNLIYGRKWVSIPFEDGRISVVRENGHSWYVLDTFITVADQAPIWLRMHMSSDAAYSVRASVVHGSFMGLIVLAALALLGGYSVTARAFAPVHQMNAVAQSITRGEDLSARIDLQDELPGDELHALGQTINGMLARLEHAFRREMQFTADVAHELRTPLNRMVTQGEYALSCEDAQEKDEAVGRILETADGMKALISQLLLLVRVDAGRTPMEDLCDLAQLTAEIAEDMLPVIQERNMTLRLELVSGVIRGNRAILSRMLINLLDNAVRYGREGGEIAVSVCREGETLVMTVRNEGEGLTEQELGQVFGRFWRADSARTTPGTGIGLSLVMSGAKAHAGSVRAESEPGKYAAFVVKLPIHHA